jgi:hypothetical protein
MCALRGTSILVIDEVQAIPILTRVLSRSSRSSRWDQRAERSLVRTGAGRSRRTRPGYPATVKKKLRVRNQAKLLRKQTESPQLKHRGENQNESKLINHAGLGFVEIMPLHKNRLSERASVRHTHRLPAFIGTF